MRILALADQPSDYLWGPAVSDALQGIDLILSCGDLDPLYLSYLVTFAHAPLLYVHGNHDGRYRRTPPEGCLCVDGQLAVCAGARILGLGGSIRYNRDSEYQYTQNQMRWRAAKLWPALCRRGGMDILLTHAPALGLGDGDDRAHVGFAAFRDLLERWNPPLFIHGHCHLNYNIHNKRSGIYKQTRIVNAFERCVIDIDL